jgi:hypothetical protein
MLDCTGCAAGFGQATLKMPEHTGGSVGCGGGSAGVALETLKMDWPPAVAMTDRLG